jgi:hypothetical protein
MNMFGAVKTVKKSGGVMKEKIKTSDEKLCLELKYCERCGGLWLRPMGGEQIYCASCAQAIADLPPSSVEEGIAGCRLRHKCE